MSDFYLGISFPRAIRESPLHGLHLRYWIQIIGIFGVIVWGRLRRSNSWIAPFNKTVVSSLYNLCHGWGWGFYVMGSGGFFSNTEGVNDILSKGIPLNACSSLLRRPERRAEKNGGPAWALRAEASFFSWFLLTFYQEKVRQKMVRGSSCIIKVNKKPLHKFYIMDSFPFF